MKFYTMTRKYGSKVLLGGSAAFGSVVAFAQEATNPIMTLLDEVNLVGVAAAVLALAVVIIGIAMTMKGPDVAKRIIRKV